MMRILLGSGGQLIKTAPGFLRNVRAGERNTRANVSWDDPLSDGGSPVTSVTVEGEGIGTRTTSAGSPYSFSPLTNGTSYRFRAWATNAIGDGPKSAWSNSVVPSAVANAPGVPSNVYATAGNGQVTITWDTPPDGGANISGYTVRMDGATTKSATSSPFVFTSVSNGSAHYFQVRAANSAGNGGYSANSNSVTPSASATAPSAPSNVSAAPDNTQAVVSWDAPASNGGSAITGYYVMASDGTIKSATSSPFTFTGLANGSPYSFQVAAVNALGLSVWSGGSNSVVPAGITVPDAPFNVLAAAGNTDAYLRWATPADGGSAITGYTVKASDGSTQPAAASGFLYTGLSNGTSYTFQVRAINAVGNGPYSAASAAITPSSGAGDPTGGGGGTGGGGTGGTGGHDPGATHTVSAPDISAGSVRPSVAAGSSHATVTGGVGPFTYSWSWVSGGTGINLSGTTSSTVSAQTANGSPQVRFGKLRCTVTDTGNGSKTAYVDINVTLTVDSVA